MPFLLPNQQRQSAEDKKWSTVLLVNEVTEKLLHCWPVMGSSLLLVQACIHKQNERSLPWLPSGRASLHFGWYLFNVLQRTGGWIGLDGWLQLSLIPELTGPNAVQLHQCNQSTTTPVHHLSVGDMVAQQKGVGLMNKRSWVQSPARSWLCNDSGQVVHTQLLDTDSLRYCMESLNKVPLTFYHLLPPVWLSLNSHPVHAHTCFSSTSSIIMKHFKFGTSSSSCVTLMSGAFASSCCSSSLTSDLDWHSDMTPVWNIFSNKSIGTNVSNCVKIYTCTPTTRILTQCQPAANKMTHWKRRLQLTEIRRITCCYKIGSNSLHHCCMLLVAWILDAGAA